MKISRLLTDSIVQKSHKGKVIAVFGARQVGKTTLALQLSQGTKSRYFNCDDYDDALILENKTSTELKSLFSGYETVVIDEAQRVNNIGLTLKKIADLHLNTQVIATGSSSLELASGISEPATGRIWNHTLYPLSAEELANHTSEHEEQRMLEQRLIYGMYPEIVTSPSEAKDILMGISNSYLYKDLLSYKGIRKPEILQSLVRAIALQVGTEVSYRELSNLLGIDKVTVENYIDLLEKCFVVFRLGSFSRNLRNEMKKAKKIYFYDNGIRNAVISNFAPLQQRNDVGALWENFMVSERVKRNSYHRNYANLYFWRTSAPQNEIDLIEEKDGQLHAFEFKWNPNKKATMPAAFLRAYPETSFQVISTDNYWTFVK